MSDVFISYAREDSASIKKIAESLKLLGLEVWFDERIPSGSSFNEIIWQELEVAKAILVGWSTKSCRSTWVMSEAMVGQKNDKLVAFFLEPCTLIPPFNLAQAEDLADWAGDWTNHGWRKIVERIGTLVDRPALVGEPGAPGLCEALADRSGHQLASWAQAYPDDPYAGKIAPIWESRQRESFAADLAAARKQVESLLKKRQTQTKANFANLEREFEAWIAQGPQAKANERPDPKVLAASLVGPLGKRHGTLITDPEAAAPPTAPGRSRDERQGEPRQPPSADPGRREPTLEDGSAAVEAPVLIAASPPRRPAWQIAAMLVLGAMLGGGATFLGTHAAAPDGDEALRGRLARSEAEAKALNERLDAATSSSTTLARQLSDSQDSLRTARAQLSEGAGRDATIQTLDAAKKAAESDRDAAQRQLDAARQQVATLTGERDGLKSQFDEKSRALQDLQDQLRSATASGEQDLSGARAQIAVLKYQLSQASCPTAPAPQIPSQSQPSAGTCYVSGTDPNGYGWIALRYAPSKSSKWSTTHLTEGMHVSVLGRDGDYWRVRVGSEEGYAASKFIRCD